MIARFAILELIVGGLLVLFGLLLFANAHWCFLRNPGCGMFEPVFAIYVIPVGLCLVAAGTFHRMGLSAAAIAALIPVVAIATILAGQLLHWW